MNHVCIIAEAGVNHNGDIELAKKMIDCAKNAGADYIKFQTFIPEKMVSCFAEKAEYQKMTTASNESQIQMLKRLALSKEDFIVLNEYCKRVGIGFVSTPFEVDSIEFLEGLDMDFWKIPSGEITNLPFLEAIGKTKREVIMSTGMCDEYDIRNAITILRKCGTRKITLLHCNTEYPTPFCDVNLNAMHTISKNLHTEVGYSDHTQGIEVPIAATALGARVIEKHFTLDKSMEGPDHMASLEPNELKMMVDAIRNIEKAMGSGVKKPTDSEINNRITIRKSIVANKYIKQGEVFTKENLAVKRPGNGISPMRWYDIIGQVAKRDFEKDEIIEI